jgi:hypothetical protein
MDKEWACQLMKKYCESARSVLLIGSHALGEANHNSDIDFIVITDNVNISDNIRTSLDKSVRDIGQFFLDAKIYTQDEFKNAKSGKEHFFLWTALSSGRTICGEDIRRRIDLNKRIVVNLVWECLETITSCSDKLEMNTQFTGCCFTLYQSLATTYFVERFVLEESNCPPKRLFMQQMLDNAYNLVRKRYDHVTRQVKEPEFSQDIKLPLSVDRKFDPSDYRIVRKQCKMVVDYLQNTYSKVTEWAEV